MELTLNLVWVCVAIAGIVLQWRTLSRARSSNASATTREKIVAMGCALVILFFVISMTDDLHGLEVLVEEKKASRIVVAAETDTHARAAFAPSISLDSLLFFPPAAFSPTLRVVRTMLGPSASLFFAAAEGEIPRGRAPPHSLA